MVSSPLDRVHTRLDQILSELSTLSQRVAKVEVYESRVAETLRSIERLDGRVDQISASLLKTEATIEEKQRSEDQDKAKSYFAKGGLVLTGGAVVEIFRQVVQLFKN